MRVLFSQKLNAFFNFVLTCVSGMAKNYAFCFFDLVIEKFTEVFHIHFAFVNVCNGCKTVENYIFIKHALGSLNYVRKLSNARGLYYNAVGVISDYSLFKSL